MVWLGWLCLVWKLVGLVNKLFGLLCICIVFLVHDLFGNVWLGLGIVWFLVCASFVFFGLVPICIRLVRYGLVWEFFCSGILWFGNY